MSLKPKHSKSSALQADQLYNKKNIMYLKSACSIKIQFLHIYQLIQQRQNNHWAITIATIIAIKYSRITLHEIFVSMRGQVAIGVWHNWCIPKSPHQSYSGFISIGAAKLTPTRVLAVIHKLSLCSLICFW